MNWKEFFKPTKRKIILSLILFLAFYFIPIIPCKPSLAGGVIYDCWDPSGCNPPAPRWMVCPLNWPVDILGIFVLTSPNYFGLETYGEFLAFPYILIVSYLVSCIFVLLNNRRKKTISSPTSTPSSPL